MLMSVISNDNKFDKKAVNIMDVVNFVEIYNNITNARA